MQPGNDGKIQLASSSIEVRVAKTHEDLAMVMAVRAAVFLAEEDNITYADEFNGNDFFATHLIAFVNGDPAGVVRCRWFADFSIMERLAIRKRYRCFKVLLTLAKSAAKLAQQKGYRMMVGRARGDIALFWRHFGCRPTGRAVTMYRGTLRPFVYDIVQDGSQPAIRGDGPFGDPHFEEMIAQIEGEWDFNLLRQAVHPGALQAAAE
jgi:hypothetical protein